MAVPIITRARNFLADNQPVYFGDGNTAQFIYETVDANANLLELIFPEGGAVDVPVLVIGDASIDNVDLTWFNGVTEPTIAVVNDAADAYVSLDAGDDAVAGSKGLYFKAAADEDIELLNLSVTGTPRIFWDESQDRFALTKGIDVGATALVALNGYGFKEYSGYSGISVRNAADDAYGNFYANEHNIGTLINFIGSGNTAIFRGQNADGNTVLFQARDNTVGLVEIATMVGAVDPYLQIGRDDTGVALNAVTDMLVLQAGGGTGNEAANFGLGISMKIGNAASEVEERGSWDLVLATATNGSEDSRFDWSLMTGGVANLAMQLTGVGVLSVDLAGVGTAAQVDLFDDYDDALVLQQGIQQHNRELMADMGVLTRKDTGSGYMMNLQPMVRLLAGGIYQSRARIDQLQARLEILENSPLLQGRN